ncbi:MAG: Endoribonuclease YbeY [Verrucomicrobia bacterium ADurb.Bin474]|nr:MAG: Endoribonuclease YbeY [Verrucomicrobia bacterium ADurb.Bin474]
MPDQLLLLPPMHPEQSIEISCSHRRLVWSEGELLGSVAAIRKHLGKSMPPGMLSIALLTGPQLSRIHGQFLDDPSPTDVITFPGDHEEDFAGEICVSVSRAWSACRKHQTSFSDELTLYLVHGCLHLAGFDDHSAKDIAAMRRGEQSTMEHLRSKGLIPHFAMKDKPVRS